METVTSKRLARMQQHIVSQSLDWIIIMNAHNFRYLSGFTGSTGVLVIRPGGAVLYVDGRYGEQAERQVSVASTVAAPRPVLPYVLAENRAGTKRIGFESNNVTHATYQELGKLLPGVELVGLHKIVETQRAVKDEEEFALIRKASRIADDVFEAYCGWLKPGLVENHVAARLEYEQRMLGGERNPSGVTIVSSDWRTAMPHGVASEKVIGANEAVMIDIGTVVGGYCSDLTRTVYLGKAPDRFKEIYGIVYDAQQRALDGIQAGMLASEADALARKIIDEAGYGHTFDHSLGHSLGLEIHERPFLNPRDHTVLEENMVFTVEPGIYLSGWGGVRIEDLVRVTSGGCEILNSCSRELIELGPM